MKSSTKVNQDSVKETNKETDQLQIKARRKYLRLQITACSMCRLLFVQCVCLFTWSCDCFCFVYCITRLKDGWTNSPQGDCAFHFCQSLRTWIAQFCFCSEKPNVPVMLFLQYLYILNVNIRRSTEYQLYTIGSTHKALNASRETSD